jgi:hypothetical protein
VVVITVLCTAAAAQEQALGRTSPEIGPVRLHLEQSQLVSVRVGASEDRDGVGKWLRLQIRFDVNHIYLFASPASYSRTWARLPLSGVDSSSSVDYDEAALVSISDLAYIGKYKLRLPMLVGAPSASSARIGDALSCDGVLGLGAHSVIWTYWDRFTLCSDVLTLGAFDLSVPRMTSHVGVASHYLPRWVYTIRSKDSAASSTMAINFQIPLVGTMNEHDARSLEHHCMHDERARKGAATNAALLGELELLRDSDPVVDALLVGLEADRDGDDTDENAIAQHCRVPRNYTITVLPDSEYSVLPAALIDAVKRRDSARFRVSTLSSALDRFNALRVCEALVQIDHPQADDDTLSAMCRIDQSVHMSLIDVCHDVYTSAGAGALPDVALRVAPTDSTTIVLGTTALRRMVWMHDLSSGISFLAAPYDYVLQLQLYSTLALFVALCLWALWAIALYPVLASAHALRNAEVRELFVPARVVVGAARAASTPLPETLALSASTYFKQHTDLRELAKTLEQQQQKPAADGVRMYFGKSATSSEQSVTTPLSANNAEDVWKALRQQDEQRQHDERVRAEQQKERVHRETLLRLAVELAHWLVGTLIVRPINVAPLSVMRTLTDVVCALHVFVALVYFNTAHFVMSTAELESLAAARLVVGAIVGTIVVCSLCAQVFDTRRPRWANLFQQLEVLLSAWLLEVAFEQWTPALVTMVLIAQLAFVTACVLCFYMVVVSDERHWYPLGIALAAALGVFCATLNWLAVINRTWDDHPCRLLLAMLSTTLIGAPMVLLCVVYEHVYPLRVLLARLAITIGPISV